LLEEFGVLVRFGFEKFVCWQVFSFEDRQFFAADGTVVKKMLTFRALK
jgi:hypothetical protein